MHAPDDKANRNKLREGKPFRRKTRETTEWTDRSWRGEGRDLGDAKDQAISHLLGQHQDSFTPEPGREGSPRKRSHMAIGARLVVR